MIKRRGMVFVTYVRIYWGDISTSAESARVNLEVVADDSTTYELLRGLKKLYMVSKLGLGR
jgi:hypothetical protein